MSANYLGSGVISTADGNINTSVTLPAGTNVVALRVRGLSVSDAATTAAKLDGQDPAEAAVVGSNAGATHGLNVFVFATPLASATTLNVQATGAYASVIMWSAYSSDVASGAKYSLITPAATGNSGVASTGSQTVPAGAILDAGMWCHYGGAAPVAGAGCTPLIANVDGSGLVRGLAYRSTTGAVSWTIDAERWAATALLVMGAAPTGPTITTQPGAQSVTAPAAATFTAAFTGTATSVAWKRKPGGTGTAVDVVGGTGATALGSGTVSYTTGASSVSGGNHNNGDTYGFVLQPGDVTSAFAALTVGAPSDTTAPTLGGSIAIGAVTSSSIALSWQAATDNIGVTGYEVSGDGGTTYASVGNALTATLTGLAAGTTYALRVRAFDAAGNRSAALGASQATSAAGAAGTFTSEPLLLNSGMPMANTPLTWTRFYNQATGAMIVQKTGLATNEQGVFSATDAALVSGQTVDVHWLSSTGKRGGWYGTVV